MIKDDVALTWPLQFAGCWLLVAGCWLLVAYSVPMANTKSASINCFLSDFIVAMVISFWGCF